jgi:uncharacterized repeat protein (TIGR03843 family)
VSIQPPSDDDPVNTPFDTAAAVALLESGDITEQHGLIRNSSNYTFLITIASGESVALAVYKPRRGERPLWDFPDGTLANRERAAFVTSEALGWAIVPPTVLRDGPHGEGSVQYFIEHDPNENYFTFGDRVHSQLRRIVAFDCITNNADRKGGHLLLGPDDHVWCIDNGLTFNHVNKLRTVVWDFQGEPVPPRLLADLRALRDRLCGEDESYRAAMTALLEPNEVAAFQQRIERMLKSGHYPRPGSGPNYPWPPV